MTHLRQAMLDELQRRNYAKTTVQYYIQAVERFAVHFHRSPDQLNQTHLREYQACFNGSLGGSKDQPSSKNKRSGVALVWVFGHYGIVLEASADHCWGAAHQLAGADEAAIGFTILRAGDD